MCTEILSHVRKLHMSLAPKGRVKSAPPSAMTSGAGRIVSAESVNHKIQPSRVTAGKSSNTANKPVDISVRPKVLPANNDLNPALIPSHYVPQRTIEQGDYVQALPTVLATATPGTVQAVTGLPQVQVCNQAFSGCSCIFARTNQCFCFVHSTSH